jgi:DNA repair protein REV1
LYKVVQPEWIMDSVEAGKLLSWQNYRLNSPVEVHQKEISFQNQGKSTKTEGTSSAPHPIVVERDEISNTASVDTAREEVHEDEKIPLTTLPKSPKGKQVAPISGSDLNSALLASDWARENSSVNPEFLNRYYTTSRLHYLSMWKAELKSIVTKLRIQQSSQSPKPKIPRSEKTRIMYVSNVKQELR